LGCVWNYWGGGEGVCGEEGGVDDFAADPGLDVFGVGRCGQGHWVAVLVDPSVLDA